MDFYRRIDLPTRSVFLPYDSRVSLWGSCFARHLADYLESYLLQVQRSPFGTMYNPLSIATGLNRLVEGENITFPDLFAFNGQYHSSLHHGSYSGTHPEEVLSKMRSDFEKSHRFLPGTDIFIFTFGTSYVYRERSGGNVVNNCHKRPESDFVRSRVSIAEIVEVWGMLLDKLFALLPQVEVIFTVSPIPHYRDGAHENKLSKATLLLAIDELNRRYASTSYFPSYEIMTDELRDYRFYQDDYAHPTPLAIRHIMERFMSGLFGNPPDPVSIRRWQSLCSRVSHRPHESNPAVLRTYYLELLADLRSFYNAHPLAQVRQAMETVESRMSSASLFTTPYP